MKFQGHDFFTPQPIKAPDVFFIKFIVHDWPDDAALKILLHLREAAGPKTRLFSMDKIIPYTCETKSSETDGIKYEGPATGEVKNGFGNLLSYAPSVLVSRSASQIGLCVQPFSDDRGAEWARTISTTYRRFVSQSWMGGLQGLSERESRAICLADTSEACRHSGVNCIKSAATEIIIITICIF